MTSTVPDTAVRGNWPAGLMTAVAITRPGCVEVVEVPVPEPRVGDALVRVRHVGLCGTDLELLHGTASYLRDGRSSYPHVFGHEWTGTVAAVGPDTDAEVGARVVGQTMVPCGQCRRCRAGQRGLCPFMAETGLYGLQGAAADYVRIPASALVPVPDAVTDREAALVEPAVTVVEAIARAGSDADDTVAVVGTGTIGLLAVQLAARQAMHVDAVGIDHAGLDLARKLGAERTFQPEEAPDAAYSLVIEASGSTSGHRRALDLAAPGGRVAAIGVVPDTVDAVPAARITLDGITILGIRHGLRHYDHVLGLLATGKLRADPLIAKVFRAEQAADAFEALENGRDGRPKLLLSFNGGAPDLDESPCGDKEAAL